MTESLGVPANASVFFAALAVVVSGAAAPALSRLATRIGLVDSPGGRKQHEADTPLTGGIAMYAGFVLAAFAFGLADSQTLALVTTLVLLVAGGIADDLRDLRWQVKFLIQLVAALSMLSWGGLQIADLGNLFGLGPVHLGYWAIPFSVLCALGTINAINMADGLDGAAGGIALVATLALAWAAVVQGLGTQGVLLLLLAGAIVGFLVWNLRLPGRSRAAVFMGDAGSTLLGFALCWFSIDLTQGPGRTLPPIVCVWLLAVPLLDMVRVMFVRALRGENMFRGDRNHLHHLLLTRGHSAAAGVSILIGASILSATLGLGAWALGVPEWVMFAAFVALLAAILGFSWVRESAVRDENGSKL